MADLLQALAADLISQAGVDPAAPIADHPDLLRRYNELGKIIQVWHTEGDKTAVRREANLIKAQLSYNKDVIGAQQSLNKVQAGEREAALKSLERMETAIMKSQTDLGKARNAQSQYIMHKVKAAAGRPGTRGSAARAWTELVGVLNEEGMIGRIPEPAIPGVLLEMKNIYGVDPGDVYWAASDVGWVVGHSYIVYAPLFHGCSSILYEGKPVGTPDPGAFWRVISQHKVDAMFTAPTAFRAIKQQDPGGEYIKQYDLSNFRTLFLAGERSDPDTLQWAENNLGVPVIDHWWQTETGWSIAANCVGLGALPVKHGSPTKAVPGYDVQIVDEKAEEVAAGESGAIVVKLPLPPGCLPTLWQNDSGYQSAYLDDFPGYYKTADAGYQDEDGYLYIMSRTDDIINIAGHRLSTGGMEEVLASHPDVAECAVVGVADKLKGQVPVGFVVLNAGVERADDEVVAELVKLVRDQIGPVASFRSATVVKRLPKTRSGKILRGIMRRIADSEPYRMPATIDDPTILGEIAEALQGLGLARESETVAK